MQHWEHGCVFPLQQPVDVYWMCERMSRAFKELIVPIVIKEATEVVVRLLFHSYRRSLSFSK